MKNKLGFLVIWFLYFFSIEFIVEIELLVVLKKKNDWQFLLFFYLSIYGVFIYIYGVWSGITEYVKIKKI